MKRHFRWAPVGLALLVLTVAVEQSGGVGSAASSHLAQASIPNPFETQRPSGDERSAAPATGPSQSPAPAPAPQCDGGGHAESMHVADGHLTVSPEPGALDAGPMTQISILGLPARDLYNVTVTGSRSGPHNGQLEPYSQGDGASFIVSTHFVEGEQVSVHLEALIAGKKQKVTWSFRIFQKAADEGGALTARTHNGRALALDASTEQAGFEGPQLGVQAEREGDDSTPPTQHFRSRPNLRPPTIDVTVDRGVPRRGYLFMSPFPAAQAGPLILNDKGEVVWFHPVNVGSKPAAKATNLQVQHYHDQPVLTWWEDPLRSAGNGREPQDVVFNKAYEQIAAVRGGNGFTATVHEFRITPQGTALLEANRDVRCDLANVGGPPEGSVYDAVVQEIDIETGLVRWEWSALDHVALAEGYTSAANSSATEPFDFFHLNSIDELNNGDLLVSARNTWTIYEINQSTGQIEFRLGGKQSNFKMGPGTETAFQHDARAVSMPGAEGALLVSVFDNGGDPPIHPQSEALIERVNPTQHTATRVRSFTHTPALLAGSQGSVEVLPSNDVVVGWGEEPWVTEYNGNGEMIFDAHLAPVESSYRALRFEWQGMPAEPPVASIVPLGPEKLAIYVSWNGATQVANWRVLEGAAKNELSAVATHRREGFETHMEAPRYGTVVKVQALNSAGAVIGATAALTQARGPG